MLFAGYKNPHPLENRVVIRVQTTPDYSPQDAFTNAITDLLSGIISVVECDFNRKYRTLPSRGKIPTAAKGVF